MTLKSNNSHLFLNKNYLHTLYGLLFANNLVVTSHGTEWVILSKGNFEGTKIALYTCSSILENLARSFRQAFLLQNLSRSEAPMHLHANASAVNLKQFLQTSIEQHLNACQLFTLSTICQLKQPLDTGQTFDTEGD